MKRNNNKKHNNSVRYITGRNWEHTRGIKTKGTHRKRKEKNIKVTNEEENGGDKEENQQGSGGE